MTITRVRYTVHAEYAAHNKENIGRVMEELRTLGQTDIRYSVFVEDDGRTFNHVVMCESEEARERFRALESFAAFQAELRGNNPEVSPVTTNLTLVGASYDLL